MKGLQKIVTIVAAAVVCAGASEMPMSFFEGGNSLSASCIIGDINCDERVNSSDASLILSEYSLISTEAESKLTEYQKKAADVNNDGKIDSIDASIVLAYYGYISTHDYISVEEYLAKEY